MSLLRRWKQIDVNITESANEAKDNVKYLYTLERFIDPLYTGNSETITDTLPALMNSIKMIHTIARLDRILMYCDTGLVHGQLDVRICLPLYERANYEYI